MEDIGTIVNKGGEQYITNLIGKNTNQIIINKEKFTSLDVDKLINHVNIDDNIISIVIKYDNKNIDINYIIYHDYNAKEENQIITQSNKFMNMYFTKVIYNINFIKNYNHDYLKKFKIISKNNDTDNEPVGGYYKY